MIDSLASFMEIAEDLANEPFMAKDEKNRYIPREHQASIYYLGDRAHFRSALIGFRRIWMPKEPSHYHTVCSVLHVHSESGSQIAKWALRMVKQARKADSSIIPGMKNEVIIDLWLNTVFVHAGLKTSKKVNRQTFDGLVRRYGSGRLECAFRNAVWLLGFYFIELNRMAVQPTLNKWKDEGFGKPSFTISSPFGRKTRERQPDGTIVIREASTKYYSEETLEQRFVRILSRHEYEGLKFVLDNLDASNSGKALLVVRCSAVIDILTALDFGHKELPDGFKYEGNDKPAFRGLSFVAGFVKKNFVAEVLLFDVRFRLHASQQALNLLNSELEFFKSAFQHEE